MAFVVKTLHNMKEEAEKLRTLYFLFYNSYT